MARTSPCPLETLIREKRTRAEGKPLLTLCNGMDTMDPTVFFFSSSYFSVLSDVLFSEAYVYVYKVFPGKLEKNLHNFSNIIFNAVYSK